MKFLALEIEKPGLQEEDFTPYLEPEAQRAWELYQQGVFRELYFRADRHLAVLVLEAESQPAARQALDSLPLVSAGLIDFEIIPLAPYPGFSRLFRTPG